MNYWEELRRLEREQEKLNDIRERRSRLFKKVLLVGIGFAIPVSICIAFALLIPWDHETSVVLRWLAGGIIALVMSLLTTVPVCLDADDILDWIDSFLEDSSEETILKKSEADRKAKIDFFERLINDPDFRAAWEAQMKERA